jgi:hypothetical protein
VDPVALLLRIYTPELTEHAAGWASVGNQARIHRSCIPYPVAKMQVVMKHKPHGQPRKRRRDQMETDVTVREEDADRRSLSVMSCLNMKVPGSKNVSQVALTDSFTHTDANMSLDKMSMGA